MGKTFSIDLKSLYEHILDSHTYFGYWIEHEESDVYYDLKDSSALYACDGEMCEIMGIGIDYVLITCIDSLAPTFVLTKEEFGFVCHE